MTLPAGQTNPVEDSLPASQSGTTSTKGEAPSKSGKKVTITQSEIDKIKSDAKAEEGRKWKKVETERDELKNQLSTLTSRLSSLETEAHNRAYEQARDEGEPALTLFQRNEEFSKRERQIAAKDTEIRRRELQLQENENSFNVRKAQLVVPNIAARYGLKPEELSDFNITDEDVLDKIAQRISGKKPEAETTPEDESGTTYEPISFQSSGVAVKSKMKSNEDVEKASFEELAQQLAPKPSK